MMNPEAEYKYRLAEKQTQVQRKNKYKQDSSWDVITENIEDVKKELELKEDLADRLEKATKKGEHEFQKTLTMMRL